MRMLKKMLEDINPETLESYIFRVDDKEVHLSLVGTVNILNSIGDWKDFVALNINTMIQIMQKDALDSFDMSMCFPHKGVGYHINVVICNYMQNIIEISGGNFIQINSATDNKTVSRRGRKAKSNV